MIRTAPHAELMPSEQSHLPLLLHYDPYSNISLSWWHLISILAFQETSVFCFYVAKSSPVVHDMVVGTRLNRSG